MLNLFIKNFGCQMNVYDSQRMEELLVPMGFKGCSDLSKADLIILNTCHIREKATEKIFSELGRVTKFKQKDAIVGVAGCVAQAEGKYILDHTKIVNFVLGPQVIYKLPEIVSKVLKNRSQSILNIDFPVQSKFDFLSESRNISKVSAFVSIQEGCDKFCTYCVVPYTRGAEVSRGVFSIEKEVKSLVSLGALEITLLGQNVNAWRGKDEKGTFYDLAQLITRLAKIKDLKVIRYSTSHPNNVDASLIMAHGSVKKLSPMLHLPLQSGSDRILRHMNRKHTIKYYMNIIEQLRSINSKMAFSSDFIVGFPGETDADFDLTIDAISDIKFAAFYAFKYSSRPGTVAAMSKKQIDESIKTKRLNILMEKLFKQQVQFNESKIGKKMQIIVERKGKKPQQYIGKSPYLQPIHLISKDSLIGKIINCRIVDAKRYSLFGELI